MKAFFNDYSLTRALRGLLSMFEKKVWEHSADPRGISCFARRTWNSLDSKRRTPLTKA